MGGYVCCYIFFYYICSEILLTIKFVNMKKLIVLALVALGAFQGIHAQSDVEFGYFDHMSVGTSVGTEGIGFDVAFPIKDFAAVRAGISFVPTIKVDDEIHLKNRDIATYYPDIKIEGKSNIFDGKLLLDYYPFKSSSFHLTAGAYFGKDDIVHIINTSPILRNPADYGTLGLLLGSGDKEYAVSTDKDGNAIIKAKVNSFKPYLGIGFGRAVQKNHRFGVSCDLGVQFWGTPGLYARAKKTTGTTWEDNHHFKYDELGDDDDEDLKDAFEALEKITVYPVLNLRLTYRIFK